ncbi:hypothetical protein [Nitrosopumilus ureiphilus]|uniref:hypothetical protein n=1 Tax=Nitrosopumilus ureiphilus TaxID=1470067 RepID=UPI0015CCB69A|nr:hypothetical protein [Nitrosopumilus ureiphilus]
MQYNPDPSYELEKINLDVRPGLSGFSSICIEEELPVEENSRISLDIISSHTEIEQR